jgi:hypothetical protein
MKTLFFIIIYFLLSALTLTVLAEERIELDTAIIRGNTESPAILYIVPWKEIRRSNDEYQGLIIGDLQKGILKPKVPGSELLIKIK